MARGLIVMLCVGLTAMLPCLGGITDGLIAYYPFTNGDTTDASGNGHHAIDVQAQPSPDRGGRPNQAYSFDGVDDFINFGNDLGLNISGPNATWSVAAWVRAEESDGFVVAKNDLLAHGWNFGMLESFRFHGRLEEITDTTNSFNVATQASFDDGAWHHVYVEWKSDAASEATAIQLYVDGFVQLSFKVTGFFGTGADYNNTGNLIIGGTDLGISSGAQNAFFGGAVDEVRIYDRPLTEAEIVILATADITPPVVTPTVSGTLGSNDWYVSDVGVSWEISDGESAFEMVDGCIDGLLDIDSAGTSFHCEVTSAGGTSIGIVQVKRDATPPDGTIHTPQDGDIYIIGSPILANWGASDDMSGLMTVETPTFLGTGSFPVGELVVTETAGAHDYFLRVTDMAGNQIEIVRSYLVVEPEAAIDLLSENILGLELPQGIEDSMLAKLDSANASLAAGAEATGVEQLGALINQIEAQAGKKIPPALADALIDEINNILAGINSGAAMAPNFPIIVTVDGLDFDKIDLFGTGEDFAFDDSPYLEIALESAGFPAGNVIPTSPICGSKIY